MKNSSVIEDSTHSPQPAAVAVCKKLSQTDSYYIWSLQSGDSRLFSQVKEIYQEFFHLKGGRVPRFALIANEQRIGLLLIDPAEEEREGGADNMLSVFLEFEQKDASSVFLAATALLCAYDDDDMYPDYLRHVWLYCRQGSPGGREGPFAQLPSLELPECHEDRAAEYTFLSSEVALPSIRHKRRKCARYLRNLSESDDFPSLILISAGRVTYESLKQFADAHSFGQLIVLTLSATVQEELDLRSAAERYIPDTIRKRLITSVKNFFSKD